MQVWVDSFGPRSKKAVWLSLLLLCPPIGTLIGFGFTAVIINLIDWRWTFYI
jgi:hypothetical protein